jgi:anti-sigma factor RsiW
MTAKNTENRPDPGAASGAPERLGCDDIRGVLMDYLSRELGEARSNVVREHLRGCEKCRQEAAEIQATLDELKRASHLVVPALSEDRRARILWAITHPVQDWIHRHHVLVSAVVSAVVIGCLLFWLLTWKIQWDRSDEKVYRVNVRPMAGTNDAGVKR